MLSVPWLAADLTGSAASAPDLDQKLPLNAALMLVPAVDCGSDDAAAAAAVAAAILRNSAEKQTCGSLAGMCMMCGWTLLGVELMTEGGCCRLLFAWKVDY